MTQSELTILTKYGRYFAAYIIACTAITILIPNPVFNYGFIAGFGLAIGIHAIMDKEI